MNARVRAAALLIGLPSAAAAAPLEPFEVWGRFVDTSSTIISPHTVDTVQIERAAEPAFGSPEVWLLARTRRMTDRLAATRPRRAGAERLPARRSS